MNLSNMKVPEGARKTRKRVGRGPGSGNGKTAGRGHNGYYSRNGSGVRSYFEGGQLPLQRRLPKFGFNNIHAKVFQIVSLEVLNVFDNDTRVTAEVLKTQGFIRYADKPVKILANGELTKKITVVAHKFSSVAKEAIEKAGGVAELVS
jgi:large subunit ribosomal protein L15